jgi:hypothetical protein
LGQAFVKQYLHELGLSEPATVYITETPPQKLKWLGFREARGSKFSALGAPRESPSASPFDS